MTNTFLPIIIAICLAGVGVLGDFFIKLSGNGAKYISWPYFIIGSIIYALTAFGWFYVLKHVNLSILGIIYSLATIILLFIVGTLFFKEHVSSYEVVGIVLGIISIALLARFS